MPFERFVMTLRLVTDLLPSRKVEFPTFSLQPFSFWEWLFVEDWTGGTLDWEVRIDVVLLIFFLLTVLLDFEEETSAYRQFFSFTSLSFTGNNVFQEEISPCK